MVLKGCALLGQRGTEVDAGLTANEFGLPGRKDDLGLEDFIYLSRYNPIRAFIDKESSCSVPC